MALDFSDSDLITSIQFWYSLILLTSAPFWFCNLLFSSIRSSFSLSSCLILSLKPMFTDFSSFLQAMFSSCRYSSFFCKNCFCIDNFFICVRSDFSFFYNSLNYYSFNLNFSQSCISSFLHYSLDFLRFFSSSGKVQCSSSISAQSFPLYLNSSLFSSLTRMGQGEQVLLISFHPMGLKMALRRAVLVAERLMMSLQSRQGNILMMRMILGSLMSRVCWLLLLASKGLTNLVLIYANYWIRKLRLYCNSYKLPNINIISCINASSGRSYQGSLSSYQHFKYEVKQYHFLFFFYQEKRLLSCCSFFSQNSDLFSFLVSGTAYQPIKYDLFSRTGILRTSEVLISFFLLGSSKTYQYRWIGLIC